MEDQLEHTDLIVLRPDVKENLLDFSRYTAPVFREEWNERNIQAEIIPFLNDGKNRSVFAPDQAQEQIPWQPGLPPRHPSYHTIYPQKAYGKEELQELLSQIEQKYSNKLLRIKGFVKNRDGGFWYVEYTVFDHHIQIKNPPGGLCLGGGV